MHTFVNSRPMAQMVAVGLIQEDIRRAEVRRERRARRGIAAAEPSGSEARVRTTVRPRWRLARVLHLVH